MSAKPDWYPDPNDSQIQRWWSGEEWTEHTAPLPPRVRKQPPAWQRRLMLALFAAVVFAVVYGLISNHGGF